MWRGASGGSSVTGASIATALGGEDTVTAFATGGQGSATALSSTVYNHRVTVCATAGDSVKLPAATVGQDHYVRNDGAASMQVYGQATETIDGVASATGVAQAAGTGVFYVCTTAGKWTRASQLNNPTITGTVSAPQVTGIEIIVAHTAIPFIHISSGSIAANGAISGITALPSAYPRAYCYFPANALATSISAGWYYCTFSTTTAGVAFLDTYTSGVPTIPSSPTAVTDGKGAYTGDITERAGITLTVPAGAMGPNGELIISALFGWGCGHDVDLDQHGVKPWLGYAHRDRQQRQCRCSNRDLNANLLREQCDTGDELRNRQQRRCNYRRALTKQGHGD
jgi:hypothetical protein